MSRRIVVGVDGSLNSRVALEHAARRAGPDGQLIVANAVSVLPEAVNRALAGLNEAHRDIARQLAEQQSALAGIARRPRSVTVVRQMSWRSSPARPTPMRS